MLDAESSIHSCLLFSLPIRDIETKARRKETHRYAPYYPMQKHKLAQARKTKKSLLRERKLLAS